MNSSRIKRPVVGLLAAATLLVGMGVGTSSALALTITLTPTFGTNQIVAGQNMPFTVTGWDPTSVYSKVNVTSPVGIVSELFDPRAPFNAGPPVCTFAATTPTPTIQQRRQILPAACQPERFFMDGSANGAIGIYTITAEGWSAGPNGIQEPVAGSDDVMLDSGMTTYETRLPKLVEVISDPLTGSPGQKFLLKAKVVDDATGTPVSGDVVSFAITPPQPNPYTPSRVGGSTNALGRTSVQVGGTNCTSNLTCDKTLTGCDFPLPTPPALPGPLKCFGGPIPGAPNPYALQTIFPGTYNIIATLPAVPAAAAVAFAFTVLQ